MVLFIKSKEWEKYFMKKLTLKIGYYQNISFVLFLYWFILVFWQNIGGYQARSFIDVIIKLGLLFYITSFYIFHSKNISKNIFKIFYLLSALFITFIFETNINMNIVISYFFMILFIIISYGLGNDFEINKKQLLFFLNLIICVVLYSCLYAIVFCTDSFTSALSLNNAYGNELSSFFISSHEYGMYLVYAIISCIIGLEFSNRKKIIIFYIVSIFIFLINLILTFSRTSMAALVLFLIVYILFSKNKNLKKLILILCCLSIIIFTLSSTIQNFFFKIILKENNLAGRDVLLELAIEYYKSGTIREKLFGYGIYQSREFFGLETNHGSIHNAYLQVLIYYGIIGLGSMLIFLFSNICFCLKEIKKDRFMGAVSLGMLISGMIMMVTNTAIIFNSPIDSYFLTMYTIIIPKYVRNAINKKRFYIK